ncbi:MAG: 50S ribosomal protein L10 [Leptolinea sp.]|nr:50S ribosomal protein L10 [Leptolinea sp.]
MAFSKKHKTKLISDYENWLNKSQAIFMLEYNKMTMKEIDALRAKVRDTGSEAHVVKNTLMQMAMNNAGYKDVTKAEGTLLVGFAYSDAPGLAKVFADASKNTEVFKLRGGYLEKELLSAQQVKALADLPPLPVMRATLLGVLQAPASKLVRTLAEPARSLAAVVKAYSDKGAPQAA